MKFVRMFSIVFCSLALAVLLGCSVAYFFRGEFALRRLEECGEVSLDRDKRTTLSPFDSDEYTRIRIFRQPWEAALEWQDVSPAARSAINDWLASEHADAVALQCDCQYANYVLLLEKDGGNDSLKISLERGVNLITYDICEGGDRRRYVRVGNARDHKFLEMVGETFRAIGTLQGTVPGG